MLKKRAKSVKINTVDKIYLSENLRFKKTGNKLLICY